MRAVRRAFALLVMLLAALPLMAPAQQPAKADREDLEVLARKPWQGDLDAMVQRRMIRALVVPTRTQYWVERGQQTGYAYDLLMAFEAQINQKYQAKNKNIRVQVLFIPTSRNELAGKLRAGEGDIAAAGLTITGERERDFDFGAPFANNVKEIVVTGPGAPRLATREDLAGQEVFVRKSSSYWTHLEALSAELHKSGKPAIRLREAPDDLQDESILEMANAGLVGITVVDRYKAQLWAKVYPKIKAREDIAVNDGGEIAWMIRKGSPKLKAEIDAFAAKHGEGSAFGQSVLKKYTGSTRFVKPATSTEEMKKFAQTVELFRKYSSEYDMDYLLMMAQGYQESRLDQNAKSPVGAIGVMQVMPETGKEMKTGDVNQIDPNIHAGVKYIRFVQDQFFGKEPMTPLDKTLFAFGAYNCGPGRMQQLRAEAKKRGLDPNVWFNNVELVAADKIGAETVTYVSNIYKYYIAYKLVTEQEDAQRKALESFPRKP
jgi:membrane-bound lytic murein transglycosylase MltF